MGTRPIPKLVKKSLSEFGQPSSEFGRRKFFLKGSSLFGGRFFWAVLKMGEEIAQIQKWLLLAVLVALSH